MTLAPNIHAKNIPIIKCKPNNGVIAAMTPKVKPKAILCGEPGSLFILKVVYLNNLPHPFLGQIKFKILENWSITTFPSKRSKNWF